MQTAQGFVMFQMNAAAALWKEIAASWSESQVIVLVSQQLIPVAAQRGASGQIQLLANTERDEVGRSQNCCRSPGCQNLHWDVQSSEPGNLCDQIMLRAVPAGWETCHEPPTHPELQLGWSEGGLTISVHQISISFPKRVPRQVADAFCVLV